MTTRIWKGIARLSLLIACLVLNGCGEESDPDSDNPGHVTEMSFSELDRGSFSLGSSLHISKQLVTIDNQDDFDMLWDLFSERQSPPMLDFEEHLVLALLMGRQRTGGYSISVNHIDEFERFLRVEVICLLPGKNCGVGQSETDPYQFVTIPNTGKLVTFSEKVDIVDCD